MPVPAPEVVQAPFGDGCFDPFAAGTVNDSPMMKMIQIPQVFWSMEYGDWRWPDGTVTIAIDYTDSTGQAVHYPWQPFFFEPPPTGRGGLLVGE